MTNHRLRSAILHSGMTQAALAETAQVSSKSVERWITQDRHPHPRARAAVAQALGRDETYLWPRLLTTDGGISTARAELVDFWPARSAVPDDLWRNLIRSTDERFDVLVYAGGFLIETLQLAEVLQEKAAVGVQCRVLLGDPTSSAVQERAAEEGLPALVDRCRSSREYLHEASRTPGVAVRTHGTTLYASQFRFDNMMLINTHAYGSWAARSPVQQVQHIPGGQLFDFYDRAFERVWDGGAPVA